MHLDEGQWLRAKQEVTEQLIWICSQLCSVGRVGVSREICIRPLSVELQRAVVNVMLAHRDPFLLPHG